MSSDKYKEFVTNMFNDNEYARLFYIINTKNGTDFEMKKENDVFKELNDVAMNNPKYQEFVKYLPTDYKIENKIQNSKEEINSFITNNKTLDPQLKKDINEFIKNKIKDAWKDFKHNVNTSATIIDDTINSDSNKNYNLTNNTSFYKTLDSKNDHYNYYKLVEFH